MIRFVLAHVAKKPSCHFFSTSTFAGVCTILFALCELTLKSAIISRIQTKWYFFIQCIDLWQRIWEMLTKRFVLNGEGSEEMGMYYVKIIHRPRGFSKKSF